MIWKLLFGIFFLFNVEMAKAQDVAGEAPIDCDGLRNSLVPYQLKYRIRALGLYDDRERERVVQVFRQKSGASIVLTRSFGKAGVQTISRRVETNGLVTEHEAVQISQVKNRPVFRSHTKSTDRYEATGPELFDHRNDVTLELWTKTHQKDGTVVPHEMRFAKYKFEREENVKVGSCLFSSFVGRMTVEELDNRSRHSIWLFRHIPELGVSISFAPIDDIKTSFETITLPKK